MKDALPENKGMENKCKEWTINQPVNLSKPLEIKLHLSESQYIDTGRAGATLRSSKLTSAVCLFGQYYHKRY